MIVMQRRIPKSELGLENFSLNKFYPIIYNGEVSGHIHKCEYDANLVNVTLYPPHYIQLDEMHFVAEYSAETLELSALIMLGELPPT